MKKIVAVFLCFLLFGMVRVNAANSNYNENYFSTDIPEGYYSGLNLDQTADEFKKELAQIISTGYVKHSYTYNNTVLADTDPDPNTEGNILCFYTGQSLESGLWNKEHVWAKSHGFPESGYSSSEPYSDAHHIRPTLISINSSRANSDFGELESNYQSDSYGNKWIDGIFEPRDEVKGDVARMMFYMATRYGYDGTFNLSLVNQNTTSASSGNGVFGNLDTLLKWHYQDPVSSSEVYRNNVIYEKYQHNRNPYIDHPEYVGIAFPNEYASEQINQEKVDNVISLVNELPNVITLAVKQQIVTAKENYDALNASEKKLVTNYQILLDAIGIIENLETTVIQAFIQEQTRTSLNVTYDENYVTTNVEMRFGGKIALESYESTAKYGVLVTSNKDIVFETGACNYDSVQAYLLDHSSVYHMECDPVLIDNDGDALDFYQFAWVITNMNQQLNTMMYATIYMEYDGKLYFGSSTKYSVVGAAKYYYDNYQSLFLTVEQKQVMYLLASQGFIGDVFPGDIEAPFW